MTPRPCVCKNCGRTEREAGLISRGGYCAPCGESIMRETHRQLRERSGPMYDRWLEGRKAAAERLIGEGRPNYAA